VEPEKPKSIVDNAYEAIVHIINDDDLDSKNPKGLRHVLEALEDIVRMETAVHLMRAAANMSEDQDATELLQRMAIEVRQKGFNMQLQDQGLLEVLADVEHKQWIKWSHDVAPEVSEQRRVRWKSYWVPYAQLTEEVKGHDRLWARHVMLAIDPLIRKVKLNQYEKFLGYMRHAMDLFFQKQFEQDLFDSYRNQVMAEVLNQVQQEMLGERVKDREESSN
jgi:hypothetical protein